MLEVNHQRAGATCSCSKHVPQRWPCAEPPPLMSREAMAVGLGETEGPGSQLSPLSPLWISPGWLHSDPVPSPPVLLARADTPEGLKWGRDRSNPGFKTLH